MILNGLLDHVMCGADVTRLVMDRETYALPDKEQYRADQWLVLARQEGFPVTLEVDGGVVRAVTMEVEGYTIAFTLPNGRPVISGPEIVDRRL
jgi:hypothetical protein